MFLAGAVRVALTTALIGSASFAGTTPAKGPLHVVAAIEPGQWELREEGRAGATRQVCINDPDMLVQFQHGPMHCSRFVVDDQPMSATVTYDCQGNGRGRTTIRASTPRALYLETQGIARGAPFDMRFEGRRTGACAASAR